MRNLLTYIVLALTMMVNISAQKSVLTQDDVSKAMFDLYRLDDQSFEVSITKVKDPALKAFLKEYKALIDYASENMPSRYEIYMDACDEALSKVSKHKYAENLRANILLHRCLVEMSCGNMITSGIQFYKSFKAFRNGEKKYAEYDGQLMLRGIYNIILSQVPEKWKSLAGWLFDKGDLQKGFQDINRYRELMADVPGACDESLLLSFANLFLSHEQRLDSSLAKKMKESTSPAVAYVLVLSNGRKQRGAEAEKVLADLPEWMFERYPLLIHQLSKYALRRLDADECIRQADRFIKVYRGVACLNDAYLMKAYAYALKGDYEKRRELAHETIRVSSAFDIDERSQQDARRIIDTLDVTLLKSRLRFEYGDYTESRDYLRGYTPQKADEIEFTFRMARCSEMLGEKDNAKKMYRKTVELAAKDIQFYGPYAAMYMADMLIAEGDKKEAMVWLMKAKELNDGEHSKEIDQRIAVTKRKIED
ncbi:MAG: hypothetical protein MJZ31_06400 [Bacteroidales bacterium]|nr:hypothetical protein [Bacteroidales bacterium]